MQLLHCVSIVVFFISGATMSLSSEPSLIPTAMPSSPPTPAPTFYPTQSPTYKPSATPTLNPTPKPTSTPSSISPQVVISVTQKFTFPGLLPSGLLDYNDSNYNLLASTIQGIVAKQFSTPTNTVIVNSLTPNAARRSLLLTTSSINARYTATVTNGLSFSALSAISTSSAFTTSFTAPLKVSFPSMTITGSAGTAQTDNTPSASPTSMPTSTEVNYKYFALLSLLIIPCCIGISVYFNWAYCCEKDRTPRFHSVRKESKQNNQEV